MSKGLTNGIGGSGDGGVIVGTITPTSETTTISLPCDLTTTNEIANITISNLVYSDAISGKAGVEVTSWGGWDKYSTSFSRKGATVARRANLLMVGDLAQITLNTDKTITYMAGRVESMGGASGSASAFDTVEYMYTITPAAIFS